MNPRNFAGKRGRILHNARSDAHARRAIAHLARDCGAEPVHVHGKLVAHQFADGFVVCEKRRYRDQDAALAELAGTRAFAHLHTHKLPRRVYSCGRCGGWHTTSRA